MSKIKIDILCDEFRVADSLRELANKIENDDDILDNVCENITIEEVKGKHYTAYIEEIHE